MRLSRTGAKWFRFRRSKRMDSREAHAFLSLHRPGDEASDPRFTEALEQVAADPEQARWWREEQDLDRAIAAKLAAVIALAVLFGSWHGPFQPAVARGLSRRNGQLHQTDAPT